MLLRNHFLSSTSWFDHLSCAPFAIDGHPRCVALSWWLSVCLRRRCLWTLQTLGDVGRSCREKTLDRYAAAATASVNSSNGLDSSHCTTLESGEVLGEVWVYKSSGRMTTVDPKQVSLGTNPFTSFEHCVFLDWALACDRTSEDSVYAWSHLGFKREVC